MRARHFIVIAAMIWAMMAWAQSTTPQTPPAESQAQSGAGAAQSTQTQPGMRAGKGMAGMHEQHMQQMKANMTRMQALLAQMRSAYANMDAKDKPAMQANIEMWQMMVDHMNQMAQHMEQMHGEGMGMGPGGHHMMHHAPGTAKPNTTPQPGTQATPPPQ